jgi:peptide/nickel transport system substrate-binding protein
MRRIATTLGGVVLLWALAVAPVAAQKKTLVIGLNQDPDILDPTLSQSYVGRIIFASICDKLYDIDENLRPFPQLAAEMPQFSDEGKTVTIKLRRGVKFNDGTPMDAKAVKYSLDRHRTMTGSNRRSEVALVSEVEVADPMAVRLRMSRPFSPILGALLDRSGMLVSPAQAETLKDRFGTAPVCVGPYTVTERVAHDRIVLERSVHYFDPKAAVFDKLVFRIMPDDNVRLANLRSGDIDFMQMVRPWDAATLRREGRFELSSVTGFGYQSIDINLRNKAGKTNPPGDLGTPLANDPRVREALELAIDRETLNQVAWDGGYTPGCTPLSPVHPYYDKSRKCPARDVNRAKQLLAQAGHPDGVNFELLITNDPPTRRVAEVLQGMVRDAKITLSIRSTEFASHLSQRDAGAYQVSLLGWSGRIDPDANIHQFQTCLGSLNVTRFCDDTVDALLNRAREVSEFKERFELYRQATEKMVSVHRAMIYLYHLNFIVAYPKNLRGFKANPDGLIRLKGVSWN